MQAVLYVGHGTRVNKGNQQVRMLYEKASEEIRAPIQELSFLELEQPDVLSGIETCVRRGATSILILPILLLAAGHLKKDLPLIITEAKKQYPQVSFQLGKPFGVHSKMIDIAERRLRAQGLKAPPDNKKHNEKIILIGRGSSDAEANSDFYKISRLLWERFPSTQMDIGFLAATFPEFKEVVRLEALKEYDIVYICPYLLFKGLLTKEIEQTVKQLEKQDSTLNIRMCEPLGVGGELTSVLVQAVRDHLTELEIGQKLVLV